MKIIWFIVLVICIIGIIYNIDCLCEVVSARKSVLNNLLIGDVIESKERSAWLWLVVTFIAGIISFFAFISIEKE